MIHSFDVMSGSALGLIIGASVGSIFEKSRSLSVAWLPLRPNELNPRLGDVPARTVLRQLFGILLFALVFVPLVWAASFFLDPLIEDRRDFVYAVVVFWCIGATITRLWRGRLRSRF